MKTSETASEIKIFMMREKLKMLQWWERTLVSEYDNRRSDMPGIPDPGSHGPRSGVLSL